MTDEAYFPEVQALRKKKKGMTISEPRSADNFSPVLEEFEEDHEVRSPLLKYPQNNDFIAKNKKNETFSPSERRARVQEQLPGEKTR